MVFVFTTISSNAVQNAAVGRCLEIRQRRNFELANFPDCPFRQSPRGDCDSVSGGRSTFALGDFSRPKFPSAGPRASLCLSNLRISSLRMKPPVRRAVPDGFAFVIGVFSRRGFSPRRPRRATFQPTNNFRRHFLPPPVLYPSPI